MYLTFYRAQCNCRIPRVAVRAFTIQHFCWVGWLKSNYLKAETGGLPTVWGQPELQHEIPSQTNKKQTVGCVWRSDDYLWEAMLGSRTEHRWPTLVTGIGTLGYFICPALLFMFMFENVRKTRWGLCAASLIPVLDGQWRILRELASSISSLGSVDSTENSCLNEQGRELLREMPDFRCTCTHMDPYTYQHSRHVYMGKVCSVGI